VLDWIVWGQVPSATTYLGMVLVIGGGLVAVRARNAPTTPTEVPR
jgi:drug/metabolite transporter (DMT)-like permease